MFLYNYFEKNKRKKLIMVIDKSHHYNRLSLNNIEHNIKNKYFSIFDFTF